MINKKEIEEFEKLKKEKIKDEEKLKEILQNQKERLIFYLILFSIILLVLVLYWISKTK